MNNRGYKSCQAHRPRSPFRGQPKSNGGGARRPRNRRRPDRAAGQRAKAEHAFLSCARKTWNKCRFQIRARSPPTTVRLRDRLRLPISGAFLGQLGTGDAGLVAQVAHDMMHRFAVRDAHRDAPPGVLLDAVLAGRQLCEPGSQRGGQSSDFLVPRVIIGHRGGRPVQHGTVSGQGVAAVVEIIEVLAGDDGQGAGEDLPSCAVAQRLRPVRAATNREQRSWDVRSTPVETPALITASRAPGTPESRGQGNTRKLRSFRG
ncbi:hypothetical protein SAMN04487820_105214 [Actinopolyspora mzabensis]|uniref:Uncharacterized protein n=1 Tax=Actinopolyspora mzabensis TaxID=995066 RepID=A0A1G8ZZ98_ACTMZ|nr:hypothetical protein SAMN04487820_105214 [Actinopolyspora mzabensis]